MQVAVLPLAVVAVMFASPLVIAVTTPSATVAIAGTLLVHVMVLSAALSGVTVAVNVSFLPTTSLSVGLLSVTPLTCTGAGSSLLHEAAIATIAATSSMFAMNFVNFFVIIFLFILIKNLFVYFYFFVNLTGFYSLLIIHCFWIGYAELRLLRHFIPRNDVLRHLYSLLRTESEAELNDLIQKEFYL
jgi:hypothetical protein